MGKKKKHSRYAVARGMLVFWCLFIGVGAVAGSVGMLSAPDGSALGFRALLPYFSVLPFADVLFRDFVFPGIALLCVNGITNITAACLIFAKKKAGLICGGIFGVTLMMWICIQFVIFPMNFMSTSYFFFGLIQAVTGYAACVFYAQEHFDDGCAGYEPSGHGKRLVVFFSRLGYTRREAYRIARETGADIYEIRSKEPTAGTLGFWWCGRYGMKRMDMPIEEINIDLTSYEHVTVCSPVWVFSLCAPVRSFCRAARGKIREVDYVIIHFQKFDCKNIASEADRLLDTVHTESVSICCRMGHEVSRNKIK